MGLLLQSCVAENFIAATSEWSHYAAVYDPDAKLSFIYLNGNEIAQAETDGDPISDWDKPGVQIQFWPQDGNPQFLDELRVYSRALSETKSG